MNKILLLILISFAAFTNVDAKVKKPTKKAKQKTTAKKTVAKKQPAKIKTVAKKSTAKKQPAKNAKAKTITATKAKTTTTKKPVVAKTDVASEGKTSVAKDTPTSKVVTVTSAFKPSLRNAAKFNFTAASPVIDTVKIPLTYKVPSQNLFFSYQPVAIKPMALPVDSGLVWQNNQYVKVGFGNYTTPYIEAGLAFGNGVKSATVVTGKYTSSKGSLDNQKTGLANLQLVTTNNIGTNNELTAKAFYDNGLQYYYGYAPSSTIYTKDSLKQNLANIGFHVGFGNKLPSEYGIRYGPTIDYNYFFDNRQGKESTFLIKAPINKEFGKMMAIDVAVAADLTSYKNRFGSSINNNVFYIAPSVQFKTPNFKLNLGVKPAWDNKTSTMLPNFTAEAKLKQEKFILQAGWVGNIQKNTYQSLTAFNPWIAQPLGFANNKITEVYGGVKGSFGNHFTYNARLSYEQRKGQPLFVNDSTDGKTFDVLYESELQVVKIHGEVGYTIQEKLSFIAGINVSNFTKVKDNYKAYGLLPLELTGTLRWKILKDLYFKSDVFFWDGTQYKVYKPTGQETKKLKAVIDLNTGVEFTVLPKLNVWLQVNNLLGSKYQRWNQYQTLGFNVLGGVTYSFK